MVEGRGGRPEGRQAAVAGSCRVMAIPNRNYPCVVQIKFCLVDNVKIYYQL